MKLFYIIILILSGCYNIVAQTGYVVGNKVNDFSLPTLGTDGKKSLSDYNEKKGVVVIFHSITCPFAKLYETRILDLKSEFQSQGVQFVFIDHNTGNTEAPSEIIKYLEKKQLTQLTYLLDLNRKVSGQFGATKVPEVFVLKNVNGVFILFYKGAIDNTPSAPEPTSEHYLQDALKALVGNMPLKVTTKDASGCAISDY